MSNVTVPALLDEGAWTLAQSLRARYDCKRLQNQTREVLLTYRFHRLRVARGGSDAGRDFTTIGDRLLQLLQAGDALCDACLALVLEISPPQVEALTDRLSRLLFPRAAGPCASCQHETFTIRYVRRNADQAAGGSSGPMPRPSAGHR